MSRETLIQFSSMEGRPGRWRGMEEGQDKVVSMETKEAAEEVMV